jgi:hypothetical protein
LTTTPNHTTKEGVTMPEHAETAQVLQVTKYQEAPQAHAQEEAQEDAQADPLATSGRQVAAPQ